MIKWDSLTASLSFAILKNYRKYWLKLGDSVVKAVFCFWNFMSWK